MNLQAEHFDTPTGKTADIIDADLDDGQGRPPIVARVFEPDLLPLFVAAPELYALVKDLAEWVADELGREEGGARRQVVDRAHAALKAAAPKAWAGQ